MINAAPADVERLFPLFTAAGEHATAAADACVVEQKVDLVSLLLRCHIVAKPLDLSFIGDIGDVRRDTQTVGSRPASQNRFVSATASAKTSHVATLQPSATSWRTSSRPIPLPPPVTTAILPANSFMVVPPRVFAM
jgi:hypothetical protein